MEKIDEARQADEQMAEDVIKVMVGIRSFKSFYQVKDGKYDRKDI